LGREKIDMQNRLCRAPTIAAFAIVGAG